MSPYVAFSLNVSPVTASARLDGFFREVKPQLSKDVCDQWHSFVMSKWRPVKSFGKTKTLLSSAQVAEEKKNLVILGKSKS